MSDEDQWVMFMHMADDFFITYALTCGFPGLSNSLFLVGHAVELYLKAIYTKQTNDADAAIKYGHKVKKLFEDCQKGTPPFMPSFKFEGTKEEMEKLGKKWESSGLTDEELHKFKHYLDYQNFYLIAEHLQDLKYLFTKWKSGIHPVSIGSIKPDDFWIHFVKEVRIYLSYPGDRYLDLIKNFLEERDIPPRVRTYLDTLYL